MTTWDEDIYGKPPTTLPDPNQPNTNIRPVDVCYFAKIMYTIDDFTHDVVLAFVSYTHIAMPWGNQLNYGANPYLNHQIFHDPFKTSNLMG